jgi:benzil reductase ((S)-benzoin forming)
MHAAADFPYPCGWHRWQAIPVLRPAPPRRPARHGVFPIIEQPGLQTEPGAGGIQQSALGPCSVLNQQIAKQASVSGQPTQSTAQVTMLDAADHSRKAQPPAGSELTEPPQTEAAPLTWNLPPMPQHLYILTGASRGLGLAMARQLLQPGHHLLCLSRKPHAELAEQAMAVPIELEQWAQDLSLAGEAAVRLESWLTRLQRRPLQSATLINNAAMIPHIGPLDELPINELTQALRVGLEAPIQLSAAFLRGTRDWGLSRRILNISSGLGRRPMASQAAYCTVKAGLDQFSRCIALEEVLRPNGAKICALAPGVIDTDMQLQLRSAAADAFPDRGRFERLKSEHLLSSAEDAAQRILAYLQRPDFGDQPIADIRG